MTRPLGEAHALYDKIRNRDRTIERLEAELKDKREALALEIMAHQKTLAALTAEREARMRPEVRPLYTHPSPTRAEVLEEDDGGLISAYYDKPKPDGLTFKDRLEKGSVVVTRDGDKCIVSVSFSGPNAAENAWDFHGHMRALAGKAKP